MVRPGLMRPEPGGPMGALRASDPKPDFQLATRFHHGLRKQYGARPRADTGSRVMSSLFSMSPASALGVVRADDA